MTNRDLYFRDPTTLELLNNGVSKVSEIGHDERQIKTLRFELETFVCDGEYARGLERILKAYLDGLGREEQKAVWVSGFFGSGKCPVLAADCVGGSAKCGRSVTQTQVWQGLCFLFFVLICHFETAT